MERKLLTRTGQSQDKNEKQKGQRVDKKFLMIRTKKRQTVDTKNSLKKKISKENRTNEGQRKDKKFFEKNFLMTPGGAV